MLNELFIDVEGMLHPGADLSFELFKLLTTGLQRLFGQGEDLPTFGSNVPVVLHRAGGDLRTICHSEVTGISLHIFFVPMQQGVRLPDVADIGGRPRVPFG